MAIRLRAARLRRDEVVEDGLWRTDGREGCIRFANGAGEIKASASALAGDFNFPLLTLWRARALPLCFDGHFIRVYLC